MAKKKVKTIKIKLVHSIIGRPEKHRRIIEALGLKKLQSVREHQDTPEIRGMIAKVPHLVEIIEE
ncbi:MAG TPA: 50S ribosomal protein L30 [Candidatus Mcinerneyibacteriales bacterium]|jgi:large subunit ribosomal protein L30|nr:50S ribosomal protein L30 [Candidatus Mcinerneyibacteriales bacterium]